MTKEEAWLVWMNATKTTDTPIEIDFEVIEKTSWWAAFSAGWDAAAINLNGWDNAYMMGVQVGKEIQKMNTCCNHDCNEGRECPERKK